MNRVIANHLLQQSRKASLHKAMSVLARHFLFLFLLLLLPLRTFGESGLALYTYTPTFVSATSIQKELMSNCSQIQALAFGKVRDFKFMVGKKQPTYIFTLPTMLAKLDDYIIQSQAVVEDPALEHFIFLSRKELKNEISEQLKFGMVNFLGRKDMSVFVKENFGFTRRPVYTEKVEDLLPMLRFQLVEAVVMTRRQYDVVRKQTNMKLFVRDSAVVNQVVVAAMKKGADPAPLRACLPRLSARFNEFVGVDGW